MKNFEQALKAQPPAGITVEKNHVNYRVKLLKKAKMYRQTMQFLNGKKNLLGVITPQNPKLS